MPKFRKKPIVIDAVRWDGDFDALKNELGCDFPHNGPGGPGLLIQTLEGDMNCAPGDWLIKGVNGEFYPCKPDIFEKTYELVP